jgi:hypothetical protein
MAVHFYRDAVIIMSNTTTGAHLNAETLDAAPLWSEFHARGTLSARLRLRSLVSYAALLLLGALPFVLQGPAPWRALGLGLVFPGGAFAAAGGWGFVWFALTLLLFAVSLALWIFTANLAAVLLVWLGAALLGARYIGAGEIDPWAIPVIASTGLGIIGWRAGVGWKRRRLTARRALARTAYLPAAIESVRVQAVAAPAAGTRELSPRELAALRYSLDRGLQPIESFGGFDVIDQFQTAGLRYQINYLCHSLALAQAHYTPSFHGYLSTAQKNLFQKMTQRKVWAYWVYESLLGNFSLNFDPIAKDNIMLGGFFNGNLGLYMATTRDMTPAAPGWLEFRLTRSKVYLHDAFTVAERARWNYGNSVYCLYPCEPSFAYAYCNQFALVGIHANDRVFGTSYAPAILAQFRQQFESEFVEADGNIMPGRIDKTGFRIPVLDFIATLIGYSWLGNPHFPDIARRNYAIARREFIRLTESGELDHVANGYDRIDIGNYRRSDIYLVANSLLAAREHGDAQVAEAAMATLDRRYSPNWTSGVLSFESSTQIGAQLVMGHLMRRDDWRNAVLHGPAASVFRGPLLTGASYPDVLVAKAWSDGEDLSLVLYPGGASRDQTLGIERLRPGARYRIESSGEPLSADAAGRASVKVQLDGRTALRIVPVH